MAAPSFEPGRIAVRMSARERHEIALALVGPATHRRRLPSVGTDRRRERAGPGKSADTRERCPASVFRHNRQHVIDRWNQQRQTESARLNRILALVRRRLPEDWAERYGIAPVLIETFVETPRYTGAVYKASGWIHVGTTQGHGRYDREKLYDKPRKDVWLRPLRRDWKRTLNR